MTNEIGKIWKEGLMWKIQMPAAIHTTRTKVEAKMWSAYAEYLNDKTAARHEKFTDALKAWDALFLPRRRDRPMLERSRSRK